MFRETYIPNIMEQTVCVSLLDYNSTRIITYYVILLKFYSKTALF